MTPLEEAVDEGHHRTVEYFIKYMKMDITQFDLVCNNDKNGNVYNIVI